MLRKQGPICHGRQEGTGQLSDLHSQYVFTVGPEASGDLTQRYLFVSKSYFMMAVRGEEISKG